MDYIKKVLKIDRESIELIILLIELLTWFTWFIVIICTVPNQINQQASFPMPKYVNYFGIYTLIMLASFPFFKVFRDDVKKLFGDKN